MLHRPTRFWTLVWLIVAVGVLVRVQSVSSGLHMDDYAQLAMVEGAYPVPRAPWDLFTFTAGPDENQMLQSRGSLPWWSAPDLRLSAFRPLSSLLAWIDFRVLGASSIAAHLHSILWFVAMILAAAAVLRLLLPRGLALLSLALFALDDAHVYPVAWLANRSALVSMTFGLLGLWGHLRWQRMRWRPGAVVSVIGLALSLLAGEYGLAVAGYFVAHALWGRRGRWRGRMAAVVVPLMVLAAYVGVHRALGYGSAGSGIYLDPIRQPMAYLLAMLQRVPLLASDLLWAVPLGRVTSWAPDHPALPWVAAASVVVFLVALPVALRRFRPAVRRHVAWLLLGAGLSLLPVSASFLSGRLTAVASLGVHAAVAAIVLDGLHRARTAAGPAFGLAMRRVLAVVLLVLHGLFAPVWGVLDLRVLHAYNAAGRQVALQLPVRDADAPSQRWVVLAVNDPMTLIYPPWIRFAHGHPLPQSYWALSMAPHPHAVTRVSRSALRLRVVGGTMLASPVEQLFRSKSRPLRAGARIDLDGMTIMVEEVDGSGLPIQVRYEFDRALDDPTLRLFIMSPRGLIPYPLGPVGSAMTIGPGTHPLAMHP